MKPDRITFETEIGRIRYGDGRSFAQYQIIMRHGGRVAGIELGPDRDTVLARAARAAAAKRIKALESHCLFAIRVTRKHISDGEARSCSQCAIAQALWHNQERMGFPKSEYSFDVKPYGCWTSPEELGIVLRDDSYDDIARIPVGSLPQIVISGLDAGMYNEPMDEWAMAWDEWAESRGIPIREWREEHGHEDDYRPYRPGPCSFVLDFNAMVAVQGEPGEP
jgi:hypothetical protein